LGYPSESLVGASGAAKHNDHAEGSGEHHYEGQPYGSPNEH
jgi:hypothetical protein